MLQPLKLYIFSRLLEKKYFLFINTFLLTLIIGLSKFANIPISYFLIYLFFFNIFFLKFKKHILLKNKFLLFFLSVEILFFFFLDRFELGQLAVILFFNFFIISVLTKEMPIDYIKGLKIGIYCIFILDIAIMLIKITTGEFLGHFGFLEVFYSYKHWPELRVNGLLQSPILSCILSIIVFLFSFYYKEKLFIFLSILFCNLSGSSRAFIFILLFLTLYYILLFFFTKKKIHIKKNLITIIMFFLFCIIIIFVSVNNFKTSAIIRYLMVEEFVKCYLQIENCKKDFNKEKKIAKDLIKIHNKAIIDIQTKSRIHNPYFAQLLTNKIALKNIQLTQLIILIWQQEYLSTEERTILVDIVINYFSVLTDPDKYFDPITNEKEINNRVKNLSDAKSYENYYLTSIINNGFISIIFRFFFILYLFFVSLKKFITYPYKNLFSFNLILTIFLCSFLDTIIFSYFFVIYVWTFLFFIIQQKENFEQKTILK